MSNRDSYNYSDLDNFDDGFDSRDYRRRQPQRRQGSYNRRRPGSTYSNRRPSQNRRRRPNRKRTRNRIIIVSMAIALVVIFVALVSVMFRGCGSGGSEANKASISTDTKAKQAATPDEKADKKKSDLSDELSPAVFKTPTIKDDNTNGESYYNIYVWNKIGFELFGGSEASGQSYSGTINNLADKLSGIAVYDMIIPNHTEYSLPQRLKDSDAPSASQADNIKAAYAKLSDKVTPINAYNYLADHNTEYTYFNSDHHWTGLGAYYAYKAFADTNKLGALSLEDCTEQTIEGFTGTFTNTASGMETDTVHYWQLPYSVTMDITDQNGTTQTYDSPYYSGATAGTLTYGVFIMGDNPLTVLKSGSENAEAGKKIAVVKESYGNAFVPYLTYNYEEVHVVDLRTFRNVQTDLASYCAQNGISEVLFLNGVMSANTQTQLDSMNGLLN